jgi:hypothetical protein
MNTLKVQQPATALVFGTAANISVGFSTDLKENRSMSDGVACVENVELQTKTNEDTSEEYPAISIAFAGVDGGGCWDTITSRTPSKTMLGLDRLKYLFNALAVEFPALVFFLFAKNGGQDELTGMVLAALNQYVANGGKLEDVAVLDGEGNIIFTSLTAFRSVFGKDSTLSYIYANMGKVGQMRANHQRALRKETDAAKRELMKQAYYAKLDLEPVAPCVVNQEAFHALYNAVKALPTDFPVFVKTGNNGRQARVYEPAPEVEA